jgi:hypothetical protein
MAWVNHASVIGGIVNVVNDGDYDVPITPSHPSLNRRDLVVIRVLDNIDAADAETDWTIDVIPGTPAVTPVPPAIGPGLLPLGTVLVTAGQAAVTNNDIGEARPFTVALGGILPTTGYPASFHAGQAIYRIDESAIRFVDGNARWRRVFDDGLTFSYGILNSVQTSWTWPGLNLATNDINSADAIVNGLNMTFTIPAGVPAARKLLVITTLEVRAQQARSVWLKHTLDSVDMGNRFQRRLPLPALTRTWNGQPQVVPDHTEVTSYKLFDVPAAGTHSLNTRLSTDNAAGFGNSWLEIAAAEQAVILQ